MDTWTDPSGQVILVQMPELSFAVGEEDVVVLEAEAAWATGVG